MGLAVGFALRFTAIAFKQDQDGHMLALTRVATLLEDFDDQTIFPHISMLISIRVGKDGVTFSGPQFISHLEEICLVSLVFSLFQLILAIRWQERNHVVVKGIAFLARITCH